MPSNKIKVEIAVAPYSDGSGHQAKAYVYVSDETDGPVVDVTTGYSLTPAQWIELREAINAAINMLDAHK